MTNLSRGYSCDSFDSGSSCENGLPLTYEQHGDDNTTGHVGTSRPTGHQEVDHQHCGQAHVAKLLVRVLRVEVVHRLLPRPVEQGGQLTVRSIELDIHGAVEVLDRVLGVGAGVELEVHLRVGHGLVRRHAHVLVLVVGVGALGVDAGDWGAACR